MPPIIEVRALTKQYNPPSGTVAVKGISFQVEGGEIFSFLGPNGAGKTTTIAMLSGLLRPTAGDALIAGHSVVREPLAVKRIIGVVPQEVALYDELSARQNLLFWGRMYGLSGKTLRTSVEEMLDLVGLAERAKERVGTFSGGMKRRLNFAAGLLHKPRVLFLDEPTVGIDPQSRRRILDLVKELNRRGTTIIYTTHYMEEAEELSHRIAIIDHGELIALGTLAELTRMVGETDTLRLHLAEEFVDASLLDALRAAPTVLQASFSDRQIILEVPDAATALPDVMRIVTEQGVRVRRVDIEEPNLETLFLHLTGRALRD